MLTTITKNYNEIDQWKAVIAQRLTDNPYFALYSKLRAHKDAFVELILQANPNEAGSVLYLCPKTIVAHIKSRFPKFMVVSLESLTERDTFLRIHDVITPDTLIILENVSRYTVLSSDKFNYLQRLRMATNKRYLIDIMPFTKAIYKLYLPWSYLNRDVLQYSNGWSFEYNYLEMDAQGRIRRAHDHDFLAEKIGPWCYIDYPQFLPPSLEYVDAVVTQDEDANIYQPRKLELFEIYDNPRKIVTEICDCANMLPSRYAALATLLDEQLAFCQHVVIFTNIVKNNALVRKHLGKERSKRVEVRTYMTHNNEPIEADGVILFETPLNQNQVSALDVLADINPTTPVFYFRNNANADKYIFGEVNSEWQAINSFTKALHQHQQQGEQ